MATKQYVQHISGQGKKWETIPDLEDTVTWMSKIHILAGHYARLPKSEYVLCPPPERWVDVTAECTLDECGAIMHHGLNTFGDERYRRRKVQLPHGECQYHQAQWFIIIEQKVTD